MLINLVEAQNATTVVQQGSSGVGYALLPFPVVLTIFFIGIVLAAMFAGLTVGLFGMNSVTLEIIASAGKEPHKTYARKILPIRQCGHQLLATLVIGNMLTVVIVSQMVTAMIQSTDFINFVVATVVVFFFAEIIPMCVCNRGSYALLVGARSATVVSIALFLFYPMAKPLGMFLECIVTHDDGFVYDRNELKKLIRVHCEKYADQSGLGDDEMRMIIGALEMNETNLSVFLTPLEEALMLSDGLPITPELVEKLWVSGKSRLPVYTNDTRAHITGVLYVKDLLNVTQQQMDGTLTVKDVVNANPRDIILVLENTPLQELLKVFLSTMSHLLFVKRATSGGAETLQERRLEVTVTTTTPWSVRIPSEAVVEGLTGHMIIGIVTFEDVIERIIKTEIYDENDRGTKEEEKEKGIFAVGNESELLVLETNPQVLPRVNFFSYTVDEVPDGVNNHHDFLTEDQKWVLANFLIHSFSALAPWSLPEMKYFIDCIGDRVVRLGKEEGNGPVLYRCGCRSDAFTLLLSGGIRLVLNDGGFTVEKRRFSSFGEQALLHENGFVPDYTAMISCTSRFLRFTMRDLVEVRRRLQSGYRTHSKAEEIHFSHLAVEEKSRMDNDEVLVH